MLNLSFNILLVNSFKEFYFQVFGRKKNKNKNGGKY